MVYSKTINDMKDSMDTKMATSMKVFGGKISNMEEENLYFKMDSYMKETFMKVRNMERVYTDGKTEMFIMESLFLTKEKDLENIYGTTGLFTEGNGGQIG